MFVTEGYFDESGDFDDAAGIFCVSGYFVAADAAKEMDREWKVILDEYKLPFFHMVDCAHGNEFYATMTLDDRIELVKRLIALIKTYTFEGFSIVANLTLIAPFRVRQMSTAIAPTLALWRCKTSLRPIMLMATSPISLSRGTRTGLTHTAT
jgi:hypothetical protein